MTTVWEISVHLAVAGDVFDGVIFCAVLFSHEMSWMRSGNELSHQPAVNEAVKWYQFRNAAKLDGWALSFMSWVHNAVGFRKLVQAPQ